MVYVPQSNLTQHDWQQLDQGEGICLNCDSKTPDSNCSSPEKPKAQDCAKNVPTEQEFAEVLRLLNNVRGKVLSLQRRVLINS
jgi:hypothetical protein